mmetsp:Transcript_27550/g.87223  ORF Transcript_27550/g.87223 Transcript_27550/m.87223 type:complete len:230 (-) Transcript_27550:483-1172(-)
MAVKALRALACLDPNPLSWPSITGERVYGARGSSCDLRRRVVRLRRWREPDVQGTLVRVEAGILLRGSGLCWVGFRCRCDEDEVLLGSTRFSRFHSLTWIGSTHAGLSDSLWWECHQPGGVTKTPPGVQSHRIGSFTQPSSLSSGPMSVYTPSTEASTHRSSATELWRCGRCASPAGSTLSRLQSVCVSVSVPSASVTSLPSRIPMRLRCSAPSSWDTRSTSASMRSLV